MLRLMVRAVIYVRVSTKEQTENLSLPTQLRVRGVLPAREIFPSPALLGVADLFRG